MQGILCNAACQPSGLSAKQACQQSSGTFPHHGGPGPPTEVAKYNKIWCGAGSEQDPTNEALHGI